MRQDPAAGVRHFRFRHSTFKLADATGCMRLMLSVSHVAGAGLGPCLLLLEGSRSCPCVYIRNSERDVGLGGYVDSILSRC